MTRGHDNGYEEPGGLVRAEPGRAAHFSTVFAFTRGGVIDAEMVTGPYDVIARVRVGRHVKVLDEAQREDDEMNRTHRSTRPETRRCGALRPALSGVQGTDPAAGDMSERDSVDVP
jgi:hypothetical protein